MPFSPRPRSLSGLIILGLVLVAVPLTAAVVHGALGLRRITSETDHLVRESVAATRDNQALQQHLVAMERSANLYLLLDDPRVAEAYNQNDAAFMRTLQSLATLDPELSDRAALEKLETSSVSTRSALLAPEATAAERMANVAAQFDRMTQEAAALARTTNATVDQRLRVLEADADNTQRQLVWTLAALIPATLAMAGFFVFLILRPLRQLDTAISELGRGTFTHPVSVKGPTDLEALGRQLEWLRQRLIDIAEERDRFLRHMSHELKTPLANLREGTDLLLEGAVGTLDEPKREVAGILRDNALKLQRLIENLLSFSAWQSQAVGLDLSEFPLKALVRQVVDAQRLALVARRIKLDLQLPDLELQADRGKLKLVLDNLLSNALKFTPRSGTIHLHARTKGTNVVIDFADTGPGIPEHDRQHLFEAFYTGDAPQSGPLKGTGIGLSVVLEFVQAHRGRIELRDGQFPGAHFQITLPLRQPSSPESAREA
ncbi:MAG: HAMP domain-containing protein [Steroidobacteraceae bacterium]|nr:HAMP domain-containing protein [Steroidobacteraceae bacterium]